MRCLAADLIGPVNAGEESVFKYALTVIDMFSYWLWIVPLRANSSKDIAEALHLHVFCDLGGWPAVLRTTTWQLVSAAHCGGLGRTRWRVITLLCI